jgi:nucleoside-diphosphate-sugar epimerase
LPQLPPATPNPIHPSGTGRVLVFGGGYCGRRFASELRRQGLDVWLTHRRSSPEADDLPSIRFDPEAGLLPSPTDLAGTTHVLVTIPPDKDGQDPVLRHLGARLEALPLQWLGYLSTTGVYGDQGGKWVDESTPTQPTLMRSRQRLACERAWRASGLPLQTFRLPAIYGPGRTPFEALRNGGARLIHKQGQVFSRVHVDDIIGALVHCIALAPQNRPDTLILADTYPCPSSETLGYAAHLLGIALPDVEPYDQIATGMGAMARSFWTENRRVSSRLLVETLGYRLRFPTFRPGYRACLALASVGLGSVKERSNSGSERKGTLRS